MSWEKKIDNPESLASNEINEVYVGAHACFGHRRRTQQRSNMEPTLQIQALFKNKYQSQTIFFLSKDIIQSSHQQEDQHY